MNFASIIARLVVPATVSLHPFGRGRLRTFADLNLCVVKVHQYLIKVAQIEPLPATRTCRCRLLLPSAITVPSSLSTLLCIEAGTIARLPRDLIGLGNSLEKCSARQTDQAPARERHGRCSSRRNRCRLIHLSRTGAYYRVYVKGAPSVGGLFHMSLDYGQPRRGLPAGQIWN